MANERKDLSRDEDNIRLGIAIKTLVKGVPVLARGPNCPECKEAIDIGDHYCRHCGQKLKWRDK